MTARLLLLASLAALGGCAHATGPDLPTCDGGARRPANPHGSVLAPSAPAPMSAPTSTPTSTGAPAAPDGGCA